MNLIDSKLKSKNLYDSVKKNEGKMFRKLHACGINDNW